MRHTVNYNLAEPDILKRCSDEVEVVRTFNQPWFRNLVWRLRCPAHWEQLYFRNQVTADINNLSKLFGMVNSRTALADAQVNIDALNRVQRMDGLG